MRSSVNKTTGWEQRSAPLDDHAMEQHTRALAVSMHIEGRAPLKAGGVTAQAMQETLKIALSLARDSAFLPPALEWLMYNGRLIEAYTGSIASLSRDALPACEGAPRIQILMRELVKHGDGQVNPSRLLRCVRAFDEVRALRMAELWAIPNALTIALCAAYLSVAEQAIHSRRECTLAEQWVAEGASMQRLNARARSNAFLEHALKIMHEKDMPRERMALEKWLAERDMDVTGLITLEHKRQALDKLWLENILASLRMRETLNWDECFVKLSRTEAELCRDPAGTYPQMDDASRAILREQVARVARSLGIGETTVAQCAGRAAAAAAGIRREISWWLYTDEGLHALAQALGMRKRRLFRRMVPDPSGTKYVLSVLALAIALYCLFLPLIRPWALGLLFIPIDLDIASALVNALARGKPHALLKLKVERVERDGQCIVVIPALLSGKEQAAQLALQLETLGCLEKDPGIDFLLLGDLKDADAETLPEDEEILEAARQGIERANERAGREKYLLLHRARVFSAREGRYAAHERKRGALMALASLLLDGESAFVQPDAERLSHRYAYAITLDAGTRMIPGTIQRMIGAIAHPLNRPHMDAGAKYGYALLAPRMELPADAVLNRFIQLYGGEGGVVGYTTIASDIYQDFCAQGIFGGKGILNLRAYHDALSDKLPDGRILSHDLIEGLVAKAGYLGDVEFFEGHPTSIRSYLMRLNRWTRGDWQLLPWIINPARLNLGALDRYKLADNLRRSLMPIAQLLALFAGFYMESLWAVALGFAPYLVPMLLRLRHLAKIDFERLILRLTLLPNEALTLADAILRTLWRLAVTHRGFLQWTTSDDADRMKGIALRAWPGRLLALMLLPALFAAPPWLIGGLILAGLWWTAPSAAKSVLEPFEAERAISVPQYDQLMKLARETWAFFQRYVPDNGLPPDNVQYDPPVGVAARTSPTNIGLYLLSCLAARELSLCSGDEMLARMERTVATLTSLEKWRGQLYNWYSIRTLAPLRPRYVSSVDSGNLAACLMLCARALSVEACGPCFELAARMEALAKEMDFRALYDEGRKLFVVGMDVENERLSASHYDLLASESRILSFTAMMLGKVPARHWAHLGRAVAPIGRTQALISWSGTMFEYLMAELLLPTWRGTLLRQTRDAVIEAQMGAALPWEKGLLPWGVSESGYYAFDAQMNYQYRAFGLSSLSLRGDPAGQIVTPYASLLALSAAPQEVLDNLEAMRALGWFSENGLYEAADASPERIPDNAPYKLIYSHMAHHQGMILASICNLLTGQALVKYFCDRPEARALTLLLQERPAAKVKLSSRAERDSAPRKRMPRSNSARAGQLGAALPDTHLISGGGATLLTSATGHGFLVKDCLLAGRRQWRASLPGQGFFLHARSVHADRLYLLSGQQNAPEWLSQRVQFDAGSVSVHTRADALTAHLLICLSPEDGALCQHLTLTNASGQPLEMEITGCFAVALANEDDYQSHPVFQNLFIESGSPMPGALRFLRRARSAQERDAMLVHAIAGASAGTLSVETDLNKLVGREGALDRPGGIARKLSGTLGHVLNPCSALRLRFSLPAHASLALGMAVGIVAPENVKAFCERYTSLEAYTRARELCQTQARAMLRFLGLTTSEHHLFQRCAALLAYPRPARLMQPSEPPRFDASAKELWKLSICGELPMMTAYIRRVEHLSVARDLMRMHEFYRSMGILCELVLVNDYGNDYDQPVRDALCALISASHLCGIAGTRGGVHLIDGTALTERDRAAIDNASPIRVDCGEGPLGAALKDLLGAAARAQISGIALTRRAERDAQRAVSPHEFAEGKALMAFNGWGGFSADGRYVIDGRRTTPMPWVNILANQDFGCIVSERGGGSIFFKNSRNGRLTSFDNDPLREGWGDVLLIRPGREAEAFVPAACSARIAHEPGATTFEGETRDLPAGALRWTLTQFVDAQWPLKCHLLRLTNDSDEMREVQIDARIGWLMGVHQKDAAFTSVGFSGKSVWARGGIEACAFATFEGGEEFVADGQPATKLRLAPRAMEQVELVIACAEHLPAFKQLMRIWVGAGGGDARLSHLRLAWTARLGAIGVQTADPLMDLMLNRFLPCQCLSARVWSRTGFYQASGAYGFRDQLQDMLAVMYYEPEIARRHLLYCAAHQFEDGDVQHWWHPDRTGVRTSISDDMLFLPYVAACYMEHTGDQGLLAEMVPFLKNIPIPQGREDIYAEAEVSETVASFHEHCLRAIKRASRFGAHGLLLMGGGDWNDGMNRIGIEGRGESVWLSEFMVAVIDRYAPYCAPGEQASFTELQAQLRAALDAHGWDGAWYRRAFSDDGQAIGSAQDSTGCRIDAIAQSWAVTAGLQRDRARQAMRQVLMQLVDEDALIVKLLTPPFDGNGFDPGYIKGYPPGVRENGGQYTHAACWVVMALAELGEANEAWRIFRMLMPYAHADTPERAATYLVEPYVIAADIYGEPPYVGRGGWTWYTGAAAWAIRVLYESLLGYLRRGDEVSLAALLPAGWDEVRVNLRFGEASYALVCERACEAPTLDGAQLAEPRVRLIDDGRAHVARFPPRGAQQA